MTTLVGFFKVKSRAELRKCDSSFIAIAILFGTQRMERTNGTVRNGYALRVCTNAREQVNVSIEVLYVMVTSIVMMVKMNGIVHINKCLDGQKSINVINQVNISA